MKSPFPGMDPYLESHLWVDVHHKLAGVITELLGPEISPGYVARIEPYTVKDTAPEEEINIMYPDIALLYRQRKERNSEVNEPSLGSASIITPPTFFIDTQEALEIRIPVVEIRDRTQNKLITAIEILSPINKRPPGLEMYRQKRDRLRAAKVHLLEIDLIRRGKRTFAHPLMPKSHYLMTLMRTGDQKTEVWAVDVKEPLPVLPVPLQHPDMDVPLDLGQALHLIYTRSLYNLSIDYAEVPPPPEFGVEDAKWMKDTITHGEEPSQTLERSHL